MPEAVAAPVTPLTPEQVKARIKENSIVLWPYRGSVEEGTVIGQWRDDQLSLIWLCGYKSYNDDVRYDEVLAVWDKKGPPMKLDNWSGNGYLTEAGVRWIAEHPDNQMA